MIEDIEPPALRLDRVTARLGDTTALDDVTLQLDSPRIAVIGANGSGKSTFARLLGGLSRPRAPSTSTASTPRGRRRDCDAS
jgi:biotin transport system ATP-binding protein